MPSAAKTGCSPAALTPMDTGTSSQSFPTLGNKNREMVGLRPSMAAPVRPAPPKSGAYRSEIKPTTLVGYKPVASISYTPTEPVCYGCGELGHIRPNCPKEREKHVWQQCVWLRRKERVIP